MTVWILFADLDYEGSEVIGVFASRESASNAEKTEQNRRIFYDSRVFMFDSTHIEEHEVAQ